MKELFLAQFTLLRKVWRDSKEKDVLLYLNFPTDCRAQESLRFPNREEIHIARVFLVDRDKSNPIKVDAWRIAGHVFAPAYSDKPRFLNTSYEVTDVQLTYDPLVSTVRRLAYGGYYLKVQISRLIGIDMSEIDNIYEPALVQHRALFIEL